jgi:transcriptional regulator with XRE-family HTH domain
MQNNIKQVVQNDIRQRLRELQDILSLTQEEMARRGGRTRISYAEYIREQNPRVPGADFVGNLAVNTGVNANWLLTGQGEMFSGEASAFSAEAQEWLALYHKLAEDKRALLLALARALVNGEER